MKRVQWIASGKSYHAVIASTGGYINLTATKQAYTVELICNGSEETVIYSNTAKNLNHAKVQSVAYGYALLKEAGLHRSRKNRPMRKPAYREQLTFSEKNLPAAK